jgi:hypothetical protein
VGRLLRRKKGNKEEVEQEFGQEVSHDTATFRVLHCSGTEESYAKEWFKGSPKVQSRRMQPADSVVQENE